MKKQILITLTIVLISNTLVLILHGILERREKKISPDVQFLLLEVKRLDEKFIKNEVEIKRLDDNLKKIDTAKVVIENNYYTRVRERELIPDSLLDEEWKKFGY